MVLYGYADILEVDLSTGSVARRGIDPEFAREYVGGMGFSSKILYDEVGTAADPLGPDNILIFANGPLTGTHAPCSGRTEITTKSPLTGSIGTGNIGGVWGVALKRAGIDLIIVRNQAQKPVYLRIDDGVAEIRDASHLWGKDTRATCDILHAEMGPSPGLASVLSIGPAGEHLVRYACPVSDYYHVAARGGAGAVMGAMKLKAIAVRGTGDLNIARPQEFQEAAREARERVLELNRAKRMPGYSRDPRELVSERGALPGKNFQTGYLPRWMETRGRYVGQKYITKKEGTCYACPMTCFHLGEVKEGKYAGVKASRSLHGGVVFDFGAKCGIDNLPAIFKCKSLCQEMGMDYGSAAGSIAFAMELFQRRLLTKADADGTELTWGNEGAVHALLHKIAYRQGFGDVLADGSLRAAKKIGKGAEHYALTTKGMEYMSAMDPRAGLRGWNFGELTNPRGGDNLKSTHFRADQYSANWWLDKMDMPDEVKAKIYSMPTEELASTWEGKPMMCKWYEDLCSAVSALGVCIFPFNHFALGPTHLAKLYSACTGHDVTANDIMKIGEKVFTSLKAYTIRQGLTRKDDTWPDRFFTEALPEGPAKGAILSRDTINRLLDEYYELRGWDKKTGLPAKEKLNTLGLRDEATELSKLGKLPVK